MSMILTLALVLGEAIHLILDKHTCAFTIKRKKLWFWNKEKVMILE